ncbi:MAG: GNAT family N-acetyltransferase [Anaerolineales bacterium]|nr:GNAT family N-acetyltransferase [Anaerolineales bacterium]
MNIRPATPTDIPGIVALVNDHVQRGDLLPRTPASIEATLDDWLVGVHADGGIIACVSLLFYTPVLAEVRSLAVHDRVKGEGWGSAIVRVLIEEARQRGVPMVFALTRAVRFFQQIGFFVTHKELFPEKVYRDCVQCPIFDNCDETAVIMRLHPSASTDLTPAEQKVIRVARLTRSTTIPVAAIQPPTQTAIIRELTLADYDAVYALWQACEGVGLGDSDSREQIAFFLQRNPGLSFVAEVNGRLIGTILGAHDGRRGYVHHLAVHNDFRRQGVARALAEQCQAALKAQGILKCHLFVFNDNERAQAFWRSVGWYDRDDLHMMSLFLE